MIASPGLKDVMQSFVCPSLLKLLIRRLQANHLGELLLQAVAARKELLTKCLITVPQHLDKGEVSSYIGAIADDTYRKPWTKAKADEDFLLRESLSVYKDATSTLLRKPVVTTLEKYESGNNGENRVIENATFDLDCDIVPSSNPSSQETVCSRDFSQETPNILQETFQKEDLTDFTVTLEELKLETMLSCGLDEWHTTEVKNLFSLKTVAEKLSEVPVIDPLAEHVGMPPLENGDGDDQQSAENAFEKEYDAGIFNEIFEKLAVDTSTKFQEMEEIVTTTAYLPDDVNVISAVKPLLASATVPLTMVEIETDLSMKKDIQLARIEVLDMPRLENPDFGPDEQNHISFLDINDIVDDELDNACAEALLDSPSEISQENALDSCISLPNCEPVSLSPFEPSLISDQRKKVVMEECFTSDYVCDEIQATKLPEPKIFDMETDVCCITAVSDVIRMLDLKEDNSCKSLEPILQQGLVENSLVISQERLATLTYAGMVSKVTLDPVETFEQYSAGNLNGVRNCAIDIIMKDSVKMKPEISDESNVAKVVAEENSQHVIPEMSGPNVVTNDAPSVNTIEVKPRPAKCRQSLDRFDPLGDFMALRSKSVQLPTNTVLLHEEPSEVMKEPEEDVQKMCKKPESRRGNKHHIVNVKLSGEFQGIVDLLEETATPYIHQLQQSGDISYSSNFWSLTPDDALFIVRQREKYISDTQKDGFSDNIYKAEVCVYALSQTSKYAVDGCLESAIGYLCVVLEEYEVVKKSILGNVLKQLVDKQTNFYQKKLHHPKVASLCKEIETWLKKKRAKSRDNEQKILVLVKNNMSSLLHCLKNALGCGNLLRPEILTSHKSEDIIQSLDDHNCLIAHHYHVHDTFPWAQFSLVVEYEYQPGSDWQQICQRQHIRHIGFLVQPECASDGIHEAEDWTSKHIHEQICVIGSQEKITSNSELLQLLESRHNLLVIERDYKALLCGGYICFSDIDVDTDSCIVIENLSDLQDDHGIEKIVRRLVVLGLKYTKCFCLLSSTKSNDGYELPGNIITNLSRLKATVTNLERKVGDYRVKLIHCTDVSEVASGIRLVCEQCMMEVAADMQSKQQWLDRSWIKEEITQEEKFLLMIPCLSSYSAQLLLKKMEMAQLLKTSQTEMKLQFPEIPSQTVEAFTSYIRSSRGLQLQSDSSYEDALQQNNEVLHHSHDIDGVTNTDDAGDDEKDGESPNELPDMNFALDFERSLIEKETSNIHENQINPASFLKKNQQTNNGLKWKEKQDERIPVFEPSYNFIDNVKTAGSSDKSKPYIARKVKSDINDNTGINERNDISKFTTRPVKFQINFSEKGTRNETLASKLNSRRLMSAEKLVASGDGSNQSYIGNNPHHISNTRTQNESTFSNYQLNHLYNLNQTKKQQERFRPLVSRSQDSERNHTFGCLPTSTRLDRGTSPDTSCQRDSIDIRNNNDKNPYHYYKGESKTPYLIQSRQSQPVATFDYNHGLDSKQVDTTNYSLNNHAPTSASEQAMYNHDEPAVWERMAKLSREFPSSEEIDASVILQDHNEKRFLPQLENDLAKSKLLKNSVKDSRDHLGNFSVRNHDGIKENGIQCSYLPSNTMDSNLKEIPPLSLTRNCDHSIYLNPHSNLMTNDSFQNQSDCLFRFTEPQPQTHQKTELEIDPSDSKDSMLSGRLYLNPNLKRISLRPNFMHDNHCQDEASEPKQGFNCTLEDDLRETTRRYLENSQQFSKLYSNYTRRPLQRVSIGLAQPQPRKPPQKETVQSVETSERVLMEQSLWATENSPPMDLEEDNSSRATQHPIELTDQEVFMYQTPKKKRKLTYQRIPGRKGQTKLLFT